MARGYDDIEPVPPRIPLSMPALGPEADPVLLKRVDVAMQEYTAIRQEIDTCLANQVAVLSFGAATVGLLVAAAATLWSEDVLLSGLLLLFVVPGTCFLALAIHAGELVRLMRAGYFLHEFERWLNQAWSTRHDDGRLVLAWEHWGIRSGRADVDQHNGRAISAVFGLLALGFSFMGFWRLHSAPEEDIAEPLAGILLGASLLVGLAAFLWVARLRRYAYRYRDGYKPRPEGTVDPRGYAVDGVSAAADQSPAAADGARPAASGRLGRSRPGRLSRGRR